MRKRPSRSIIYLLLVTLIVLLLPFTLSEKLRSFAMSFTAPIWNKITFVDQGEIARLKNQVKFLEIENNQLKNQSADKSFKSGAFPAKVIYRSHSAWQSTLWINVGYDSVPFSLKNAPVLKGDVVVGVIDEVKAGQSRVRLLSDPSLNPFVRVVRKGVYLAKGEMNGRAKPAFRRPGTTLLGTGFNYDFPDKEGPAKGLREDILKPGDLLVTTGLDGVFPKGLKVARVVKVFPLKEGDFYYDLEAESLAGTLNDLEQLHVIPPMITTLLN